jgi:hypothetical protein
MSVQIFQGSRGSGPSFCAFWVEVSGGTFVTKIKGWYHDICELHIGKRKKNFCWYVDRFEELPLVGGRRKRERELEDGKETFQKPVCWDCDPIYFTHCRYS